MDECNDNRLPAGDERGHPEQGKLLDGAFQALLDPLRTSLAAIQEKLDALREQGQTADLLPPSSAPPEPRMSPLHAPDPWAEILLGAELCANATLSQRRQEFLADVLAGVVAARALAGQLLLVQTASVDQMPELLKHVGEAYYRWRPQHAGTDDPLEKALANWLTRRAEAVGLPNSIQLVRPGERFDVNRHIADGRGVEVTTVHGWIVRRDNNKVYTKAAVSVR